MLGKELNVSILEPNVICPEIVAANPFSHRGLENSSLPKSILNPSLPYLEKPLAMDVEKAIDSPEGKPIGPSSMVEIIAPKSSALTSSSHQLIASRVVLLVVDIPPFPSPLMPYIKQESLQALDKYSPGESSNSIPHSDNIQSAKLIISSALTESGNLPSEDMDRLTKLVEAKRRLHAS